MKTGRNSTHGLSGTLIYDVWNNMIQRCYNKKHPRYKDYGGRGIRVCKRWKRDIRKFIKDMGKRPKGMTLDREDNDKSYNRWNCRWATVPEQNRNKSNRHIITIEGVSKSIVDWAEEFGILRGTFVSRVRSGWTGKRLLEPTKGKS